MSIREANITSITTTTFDPFALVLAGSTLAYTPDRFLANEARVGVLIFFLCLFLLLPRSPSTSPGHSTARVNETPTRILELRIEIMRTGERRLYDARVRNADQRMGISSINPNRRVGGNFGWSFSDFDLQIPQPVCLSAAVSEVREEQKRIVSVGTQWRLKHNDWMGKGETGKLAFFYAADVEKGVSLYMTQKRLDFDFECSGSAIIGQT